MFDPYHKWLGIPPGKRPPTLYQLLAIAEGEKDRDVIEAATVRQSAYVRNFQKGPNADEAAKLLSEISDARAILTDPARRKAYDEKLEAEKPKPRQVAAPARPVAAVPAQAVVVRAAPVAKAPVKPARPARRQSNSSSILMILGIVGVVATATVVGVYVATRGSGGDQVAANSDSSTPRVESDPSPPPPKADPSIDARKIDKDGDKPPFDWDQVKVDRQHPPGPPPGFGRPPNIGPPPGFGRPPNFGPPGMFRGPDAAANGGQRQNPNPPKKDGDEPPAQPRKQKKRAEGIDGALELLKERGHFDIVEAAKILQTTKPEDARKAEVAAAINDILVGEKGVPDELYDAAIAWGDDKTVLIIADKLAARPWTDRGAIRAAGKMQNAKLVRPVCELLVNFFHWEEASRALKQMGPVAEPQVRVLLTHRDPKMRAEACSILAFIGTSKSVAALRRASSDKDKNVSTAAKAAFIEVNERVKEKKSDEGDDSEEKSSEK
jgi:hypothetical protein